jgi:hypothetical protein
MKPCMCLFQLNSRERWYWVFQWLEWPCLPWTGHACMYAYKECTASYLVSFCRYTWTIPRTHTPWCGIAAAQCPILQGLRGWLLESEQNIYTLIRWLDVDTQVGIVIDSIFYTIKFKNRIVFGSGSITIYFWTKIY